MDAKATLAFRWQTTHNRRHGSQWGYGPDYDLPDNLVRLHQRALGAKRSAAFREFALGLEALHRFVEHAPLTRVHACVFGVLAMESEAIDPRH